MPNTATVADPTKISPSFDPLHQNMTTNTAIKNVWTATAAISGGDANQVPDPDTSLFDIGLDSLGLAELVIQLEEVYGEGAISVDDILAAPTIREVAALFPNTSGTTTKTEALPSTTPTLKATPAQVKAVDDAKNTKPSPATMAQPTSGITHAIMAPTPKTPVLTDTAALIVDRLAKLEQESRELCELVLHVSGGMAAIPLASLDDTADKGEGESDSDGGGNTASSPEAECAVCEDSGVVDEGHLKMVDDAPQWIRTSHVGSLPRAKAGADVRAPPNTRPRPHPAPPRAPP